MNKEELQHELRKKIKSIIDNPNYENPSLDTMSCVTIAIEYSNTQNALLLEEIKELKEKQTPEAFIEFVDEMKYMVKQYQNSRYSRGQETRDKLSEELDNIMRLEKFRTKDF